MIDVNVNLSYGSDTMQKWDLYIPKVAESGNSKAKGVIVFVHGGAWRRWVTMRFVQNFSE
jgi:acetyl esterase/lipase